MNLGQFQELIKKKKRYFFLFSILFQVLSVPQKNRDVDGCVLNSEMSCTDLFIFTMWPWKHTISSHAAVWSWHQAVAVTWLLSLQKRAIITTNQQVAFMKQRQIRIITHSGVHVSIFAGKFSLWVDFKDYNVSYFSSVCVDYLQTVTWWHALHISIVGERDLGLTPWYPSGTRRPRLSIIHQSVRQQAREQLSVEGRPIGLIQVKSDVWLSEQTHHCWTLTPASPTDPRLTLDLDLFTPVAAPLSRLSLFHPDDGWPLWPDGLFHMANKDDGQQ